MKGFLLFFLFTYAAFAQVDPNLSPEARELYLALKNRGKDFTHGKIIFGQQGAFHEGRGWRLSLLNPAPLPGQLPISDVAKVVGKDPLMTGIDFNEIGHWNEALTLEQMRTLHSRGGIITMSWHMKNFFSSQAENNAWDTSHESVKDILYKPLAKATYLKELDRLVAFMQKVPEVPVIFRPFHEHNYSWFWWGSKHCTVSEYKAIWKLTADYLMQKGVHNFLYAYSPNYIEADYLERYPGDPYVDILGVDMYFKGPAIDLVMLGNSPLGEWKRDVLWLLKETAKRDKIAAITEFGNEGLTYNDFWTDYFGWPIQREGIIDTAKRENVTVPSIKMAYIMLWRNDMSDPKHFFAPFPGQDKNPNFLQLFKKKAFAFLGADKF